MAQSSQGQAAVPTLVVGESSVAPVLDMPSPAMMGGSLPPRKRLLANLKQSGWVTDVSHASDSPSSTLNVPSAPASDSCIPEGQPLGQSQETKQPSAQDGLFSPSTLSRPARQCENCGTKESGVWRRGKKGDTDVVLCNSCGSRYSKGHFCPHCSGIYPEESDLLNASTWLACSKCKRHVHSACEQKDCDGKILDQGSYLCPECKAQKPKDRFKESPNGLLSRVRFTDSHGSSGRPLSNGSRHPPHKKFSNPAPLPSSSTVSEDNLNPPKKKPRASRDARFRHTDSAETAGSKPNGEVKNGVVSPKAGEFPAAKPTNTATDSHSGKPSVTREFSLPGKLQVSSSSSALLPPAEPSSPTAEDAAAAKAAAVAATQRAAAAKEKAAAKAATAATAAAKAKAALEVAAAAARAEALAVAELKSGSNSKPRSLRTDVRGNASPEWNHKSERSMEKGLRSEKGERSSWGEKGERCERGDRGDKGDKAGKGNRVDRRDCEEGGNAVEKDEKSEKAKMEKVGSLEKKESGCKLDIDKSDKYERADMREKLEKARMKGHREGKLDRQDGAERSERLELKERLNRSEKGEKAERSDRGGRGEKLDKGEKSERPEKGERGERSDKGERGERLGKGERCDGDGGERRDKKDRIERPAKWEKGDRSSRVDRFGKFGRAEKGKKAERSSWGERGDGHDRGEKGERLDRKERPLDRWPRVDRAERAEKAEKDDRKVKVEGLGKNLKAEKSERGEKAGDSGRGDKVEKIERLEKAEKVSKGEKREREDEEESAEGAWKHLKSEREGTVRSHMEKVGGGKVEHHEQEDKQERGGDWDRHQQSDVDKGERSGSTEHGSEKEKPEAEHQTRERSSKPDRSSKLDRFDRSSSARLAKEEVPLPTRPSSGNLVADKDEELARQLHRVINSSPRILNTFGPTPRRSRASKTGAGGAAASLSAAGARTGKEEQEDQESQGEVHREKSWARPTSATTSAAEVRFKGQSNGSHGYCHEKVDILSDLQRTLSGKEVKQPRSHLPSHHQRRPMRLEEAGGAGNTDGNKHEVGCKEVRRSASATDHSRESSLLPESRVTAETMTGDSSGPLTAARLAKVASRQETSERDTTGQPQSELDVLDAQVDTFSTVAEQSGKGEGREADGGASERGQRKNGFYSEEDLSSSKDHRGSGHSLSDPQIHAAAAELTAVQLLATGMEPERVASPSLVSLLGARMTAQALASQSDVPGGSSSRVDACKGEALLETNGADGVAEQSSEGGDGGVCDEQRTGVGMSCGSEEQQQQLQSTRQEVNGATDPRQESSQKRCEAREGEEVGFGQQATETGVYGREAASGSVERQGWEDARAMKSESVPGEVHMDVNTTAMGVSPLTATPSVAAVLAALAANVAALEGERAKMQGAREGKMMTMFAGEGGYEGMASPTPLSPTGRSANEGVPRNQPDLAGNHGLSGKAHHAGVEIVAGSDSTPTADGEAPGAESNGGHAEGGEKVPVLGPLERWQALQEVAPEGAAVDIWADDGMSDVSEAAEDAGDEAGNAPAVLQKQGADSRWVGFEEDVVQGGKAQAFHQSIGRAEGRTAKNEDHQSSGSAWGCQVDPKAGCHGNGISGVTAAPSQELGEDDELEDMDVDVDGMVQVQDHGGVSREICSVKSIGMQHHIPPMVPRYANPYGREGHRISCVPAPTPVSGGLRGMDHGRFPLGPPGERLHLNGRGVLATRDAQAAASLHGKPMSGWPS